LISFRHLG